MENDIWDMYDKWLEVKLQLFERDVNDRFKQFVGKVMTKSMEQHLNEMWKNDGRLNITINFTT